MFARETEGIRAEVPAAASGWKAWLQRGRTRQLAVTRLRRRSGDNPGSDVRPDRLSLLQARLRARHQPIVRAA
jgi:hypothetical protein